MVAWFFLQISQYSKIYKKSAIWEVALTALKSKFNVFKKILILYFEVTKIECLDFYPDIIHGTILKFLEHCEFLHTLPGGESKAPLFISSCNSSRAIRTSRNEGLSSDSILQA